MNYKRLTKSIMVMLLALLSASPTFADDITAVWDFKNDQPAGIQEATSYQGVEADIPSTVEGIVMHVDATAGKLYCVGRNNAQMNPGTILQVPVVSTEDVVTVEGYPGYCHFAVGGDENGENSTVSHTATSIEVVQGYVEVTATEGNNYIYTVQVVQKPKQSQGGGGTAFDNVDGTIKWNLGNEQSGTVSADIADAISIASVSAGSGLDIATATYFETEMMKYTPKTSNSGCVEGVMIEYRVKPKAGVTFKPTSVSYAAVKVGTDNATYSWSYTLDGVESTITKIDPKPDLLRNSGANGTPEYGGTGTAVLMHTHELTADAVNDFTFRFYISDCANNKNICIGKVTISGTVNGEAIEVNTYTLSAVASPAEGGKVTLYPVADSYEEGSDVIVTAEETFGYDFVNWTNQAGEEVSNEAKFVYTVNADDVLTANFKKVETYALALTVDGTNDYMVTINPAPTVVDGKMMYEAGQAVQLQANQYEGFVTFNNWSDGDTSSSKLLQMNADVELTAYYVEADIIAGWDFYKAGGSGRKADFASEENTAAALTLVNTETGATSGWLDKSTEAANGYESFAGAAVNWRTGETEGDVGHWHWQTSINAQAFTDINVQFQMLYNYNAYQTYNVEYSLDGEAWKNVGSITMTGAKTAASFSKQLPDDCNNAQLLFIRMIADKSSKVDGSSSKNDGNTLAMFFITGTPKIVDDGVAPVLVSTVPADGTTGVSASGKIILTFDERVKLADGAVAYINNSLIKSITQNPTPGVVSGKTISFEYKGLEYATQYNFALAGKTVSDLTDNYLAEPIAFSFTTMERPTVDKKLYDFVVPDDGTFKDALAAAAARANEQVRYRIFVKQGDYIIPANQNAKVDGNDGNQYADPKTYFNSPNVSFIGEDPTNTSITNEMPNALSDNPDAGANGQANPLEGIRTSGVLYLQSGCTDTYFQDIKLYSNTADATGRNVVLVDGGNRTICKNVTLWAYQDTYVSDSPRNFYYFEGGLLRGRTDFLCGSGDVFYNNVTLQMCQDGGYIAVPRDNVKYGYVFKDCTIKGENSRVDGNYYLGRPWTKGAEVYYIDTKMEAVPRAEGWAEMSDDGCTRMAEYNSMTANGSVIDLSHRATSLGKVNKNPNEPILTADEALEIGNMHNMFGEWDPTLATEQAPAPQNVELAGNKLTWTDSKYALLYAIVKDGKVVDFTLEPSYTVDDPAAKWAVRAANEMGGLGEATAASQSATLRGDVNHDGQVGIGDIVAITNVMAGDLSISKEDADVNGDGQVGIGDIVAITNIMAGIEN